MKNGRRRIFRMFRNAFTVLLVLLLLPFALRLADRLFPDLTGRIQAQSTLLLRELKASSRLETMKVSEEGTLESNTRVILLGEVGRTTIHYRYEGSFGIDLGRVELRTEGTKLIFLLPPIEILNDHIEPLTVRRKDFLSYAIDPSIQSLMELQRLKCRDQILTEKAVAEEAWEDTVQAFRKTIAQWIDEGNSQLFTYEYRAAAQDIKETPPDERNTD